MFRFREDFATVAQPISNVGLVDFLQPDTRGFMIWPKGFKRRDHPRTLFDGMRTTRMERTAAGWVHRGWWIAGQKDALPLTFTARVGQWHSADERLGIRMQRALEHV